MNFVMMSFNKSIQVQWDGFGLPNVEARTANSFSFQYWNQREGDGRENKFSQDPCIHEMEEVLGGMEGDFGHAVRSCKLDGRSKRKFSAQVKQTIMTFCQTADLQIDYRHTPSEWLNSSVAQELSAGDLEMVLHGGSIEGRQREVMSPVPEKQRVKVFEKAKEIWNGIVTKRFGSLTWGYSITLKRFQLEKPNLNACLNRRKFSHFDVLLIDEAQDMNPAMLDICMQQSTPKVIVGDPHQQIYQVWSLNHLFSVNIFYWKKSLILSYLVGKHKTFSVVFKELEKS